MRPASVLWLQCSLQVWASVSSSTSVGSRPRVAEVLLDRLHLDQRQVQLAVAAELQQAVVVQFADRHVYQFEFVRLSHIQLRQLQRADDHLFDRIVGQHLAAQRRQLRRRQVRKARSS